MADQDTNTANDTKKVLEEQKEGKEESNTKGQKRKKPATPAKTSAKKKHKTEPEEVIKEDGAEASTEPESTEEEKMEEDNGAVPLLDQPTEVTGTRVRKQVQRLNITTAAGLESPDRRKVESLPGRGIKLGSSPRILAQWQNIKQSELTLLHRLLFKRPGTAHEIKKNIKEFSGFPFSKEDKEFESRKHLLEKNTMTDLKFICQVLCLEKSGTKENIVERILDFCLCPNPVTLPVKSPKRKKVKAKSKQSKKEKKADSSQDEGKASRKSPKKNVKSSEVVEDDSSDSESDDENPNNESQSDDRHSDEEECTPSKKVKQPPLKNSVNEEEKESPAKGEKKKGTVETLVNKEKETPAKGKKGKTSPKPEKKEKDTPSKVEKSKKETPAKKTKQAAAKKAKESSPAAKAKKSPKKSARMEIKVKLPPLRSKKDRAPVIESDNSGNEEEVTKSAEEAPVSQATRETKKVEEEKEQQDRTVASGPAPVAESGDKKLPTDDELVTTIKDILKDANLENLTMKNLCRKVYDTYPDVDLEKTKKDFIRSTAKEILGAN